MREQAPTGRFNIRWDNRIAFFNGIAMNGLLSLNEVAPDPELEQGVLAGSRAHAGDVPGLRVPHAERLLLGIGSHARCAVPGQHAPFLAELAGVPHGPRLHDQ